VATLGLCCGVTAAVCQAPWLMFYTTTKLPPRCLLGGDSGFLTSCVPNLGWIGMPS
jgi:hypothetical protein